MSVSVETLGKLERRIRLTLPAAAVNAEIESRLKHLARTVKAAGFRPGKVPLSVVAQRFGASVHREVMNDKVGKAFAAAVTAAKLHVAGAPRIAAAEGASSDELAFDATFEVYPEVKLGDLSSVAVEHVTAEVTEVAVNKTLDILRKQRRSFTPRPPDEPAAEGDRVSIAYEGKVDGAAFEGGKAEAHQFIIGEGQMLAAFDAAVRGMKVGESKTFPLLLPAEYQNKDVAGKEADFLVTLKTIELQRLPEVDAAFAKSLEIRDSTVETLRTEIKRNLQRELKLRVLARNKSAVMDALIKIADFDVPTTLVDAESEQMMEAARANLKRRGVEDVASITSGLFSLQAERRVRLGLVAGELVRVHNLQAKPEQLQAYIEEIAQGYDKPSETVRWYLGNRQRMAEVEEAVVENNLTAFVLAQAKVNNRQLSFDELMAD